MKIKEALEDLVLFDDRVGIRILPSKRAKYMVGDVMYFGRMDYKGCEIAKAYAKNDAIVFVVTRAEALKHNLVKGIKYE